jgi:hypothetical protein
MRNQFLRSEFLVTAEQKSNASMPAPISSAPLQKNKPAMRNSRRVGRNPLLALAFLRLSGAIAEAAVMKAAVMNHKTKKCWGTIRQTGGGTL